MTLRQYTRLVFERIASIGLDPRIYSTRSLRRTKVILIYRRTGNLLAVQLLLGHTKIESTVRSAFSRFGPAADITTATSTSLIQA